VGASLGLCPENGRDLDVTFFPSWLQDTTSKPVEKSWSGLFCRCFPVRTGRYWKEGRNVREEDDGAESGGVLDGRREMRQAWFELCVGGCGTKDSCSS